MTENFLKNIIFKKWKRLIHEFGFEYFPEKSNTYRCWLKNEYCAIEIKVERYLDRFDIGIVNPKKRFPFPQSIFMLAEVTKGVDSMLFPYLRRTSSKYNNNNKYFYQRYFLKQDNYKVEDFEKQLEFFQNVLLHEFHELINGNFDSCKKLKEHILNYYKVPWDTPKEKLEVERDFEDFHRAPFNYPTEKVIDEINKKMNEFQLATFSQFEINGEERQWLEGLKDFIKTVGKPLSAEYIACFEVLFQVTLPRDYKLFLNYIGNGFYRFRTLEQAICNSEDLSFPECFDFIELNKPFTIDHQTQIHSRKGFLRIYDYGCGIVHYLIINGEHYGKIWYRSPDYGDIIERYPDYKPWIPSFREFLKSTVQR